MAHDVGQMMIPLAVIAVPTLGIAVFCREWAVAFGLLAPLLAAAAGAGVARLVRECRGEADPPHGPVTALAWLLAAVVCAVPFLTCYNGPVDAIFESMSGLTSTGLSVADDPAALPRSIQWWRSTLLWLGGVGILYLVLAGIAPSPRYGTADKTAQDEEDEDENAAGSDAKSFHSLREAVSRTWVIYGALTLVTAAATWGAGMPLWDAANHAQAAVSTGGFAIDADSLADYPRAAQAVALAAMLVTTLSFFTLRQIVFAGEVRTLWKHPQARLLAGLLAGGGFVFWLIPRNGLGAWDAAFQWATALCTGGFSTVAVADLTRGSYAVLIAAMLIGGSVGSTAGGIKLARLRRLCWAVLGRGAPDDAVSEAAYTTRKFAAAFALTYVGGAILLWLAAGRPAPADAAFDAASALATVGLSSGLTGADLPAAAKLVLILLMWAGRLEILAVAAIAKALVSAARPRD